MINIKNTYEFTDSTILSAIKLFDKTINHTVSFCQLDLIPLHAMTSLCISIKIHQSINQPLDYNEATKICQELF